ncbi:hypothetical protein L4X63_23420 [Geomonas sp. Red32]|uniref:hypothetical protein n=1 Tax=Geomonas sp. Red32 TaxID=2912856 RepID=UPI00202D0C0E|nr:hypothetical protein [Geomonas sp. Red32]MCM0084528.1 hypothetical protein [Geomonas sp. Red32]
MFCKMFVPLFCILSICGCSSVKSTVNIENYNTKGLTYYMPKKDFIAIVTIENKNIKTIDLRTTSAYADYSTQYILKHSCNVFGKNTLDVGVNESGLLTSAKSTTESNVNDIFNNLAATAGHVSALGVKGKEGTTCKDGGHSIILKEPGSKELCGLTIKVELNYDKRKAHLVGFSGVADETYSGVFYRQSLPYMMTATGPGIKTSALVFSPSQSPTQFLPASKTFFSGNKSEFEFNDGVPSKYMQQTEGELLSIAKLPSDILNAYFTAIGTVFDSFKTKDSKQADALTESLKLQLQKKKYDACVEAIRTKDESKLKDLGCQ